MRQDFQEVPCDPLLSSRTGKLGAPFALRTGKIESVFVPPLAPQKPNLLKAGGDAKVGLFSLPHESGSGRTYWLVLSCNLEGNKSDAEHTAVVERFEELSTNHTLKWYGGARYEVMWRMPKGQILRLAYYARTEVMESLREEFGDPQTRGLWLFSRLTPRRQPGALRVVSERWYQLWVPIT